MDMTRVRDIEIDGGLRHEDDGTRIHLTVREAAGLRRPLADIVLSAEQFVALARGGTVLVRDGVVPVEMLGGDRLVDALDQVTSHDGNLTDRAPVQIADDLIDQLSAHARVGFTRAQALRQALRSTTPRPTPEGSTR